MAQENAWIFGVESATAGIIKIYSQQHGSNDFFGYMVNVYADALMKIWQTCLKLAPKY